MKNDLTIIIAHYKPKDSQLINPLLKTLEEILKQKDGYNIEVIIADDGSYYSNNIIENYSQKISSTSPGIPNENIPIFHFSSRKFHNSKKFISRKIPRILMK